MLFTNQQAYILNMLNHLQQAYRQGMRGPKYVWITLGWYHADWWVEEAERQLSNGNDFCQPEELASLVEKSLSMRGLEFGQDLSLINFHGVVRGWS